MATPCTTFYQKIKYLASISRSTASEMEGAPNLKFDFKFVFYTLKTPIYHISLKTINTYQLQYLTLKASKRGVGITSEIRLQICVLRTKKTPYITF